MSKSWCGVGIAALLIFHSVLPVASSPSQSVTFTSQADFGAGTIPSSIDVESVPGNLQLGKNLNEHVDTSKSDFAFGSSLDLSAAATDDPNSSVSLQTAYTLNENSNPSLGGKNIYGIDFDPDKNLIYIGIWGTGVKVLNNQGTTDRTDDVIIGTYSTSSTPALGSNNVHHVLLDRDHDVLYVSTWGGGLSVINTQDTASLDDDQLVITYTNLTSPPVPSLDIQHVYRDPVNNVIYVSTWGQVGVAAINTQGTVSAADDTLIRNYVTGNDNGQKTYLDNSTGLLYITGSGVLQVFNTQNTISGADDVKVATYHSGTTPAIAAGSAYHAFVDNSRNLIYVGSRGGLSVVDNKGTVTQTDDVTVFIYTSTSNPPIAPSWVMHSYLDTATNYLYVTSLDGVAVIDTKGTYSAADDTLVKMYSGTTSPAIAAQSATYSYLDADNDILYIASSDGLSIVYLDGTYSKIGSYQRIYDYGNDLWETKTPLQIARIGAASGAIEGKIYIAGGTQDYVDQNTFEMYDPDANTWTAKAPMSAVRVSPGSGVIDGKLYVVGGRDINYGGLSSLEVYDPDSNTWETKAGMAVTRVGPAVAVVDGKLYVIGGVDDGGGNSLSSVEMYDPLSNTWQNKAAMPGPRGQGHTAQTINGKIYVAGGSAQDNTPFLDTVLEYDPSGNSWTTKASMPGERAGLASVVHDGKFIVIGGTDNTYDPVDTIFSYNPETNAWLSLNNIPDTRHRASVQIIGNYLYVIGGKNINWESSDAVYRLPTNLLVSGYSEEMYTRLSWEATIPEGTSIEMMFSRDGGNNFTTLGTAPGGYYLTASLSDNFMYKAVLSTNIPTVTPQLNSVTIDSANRIEGLYQQSGEYLTRIIDAGDRARWTKIYADKEVPSGAGITFSTRTGNTQTVDDEWSEWTAYTEQINSPDNRYLQLRIQLSTEDTDITPVLRSVEINFETPVPVSTDTDTTSAYNYEAVSLINESGGAITPIGNSDTGMQRVVVIIPSGTFSGKAFLTSELQSMKEMGIQNVIFRTRTSIVRTGGEQIGIRVGKSILWQVGGMHKIFFYGDAGYIMYPDQLRKPAIISLSYSHSDLIPAGDVRHPFNPRALRLAYSSDGVEWKIMPNSIVDPVNRTVAAIHKPGGYYMIVAAPTSKSGTVAGAARDKDDSLLSKESDPPPSLPPPLAPSPTANVPTQPDKKCFLWWCW